MTLIRFLLFLIACAANIRAHTHWVVTETGLIQPREEPIFELANPFDLLTFLNQDIRWAGILSTYKELLAQQGPLNRMWRQLQKEMDIESHLNDDIDCVKSAPLYTVDWYTTHFALSESLTEGDFALRGMRFDGKLLVPDCKKISSLIFSMFTFEHLDGMFSRENLTSKPETVIADLVDQHFHLSMDEYGHWVATALKRNTSSWLHYHLATMYWRFKGNPAKAVECIRRSVLYVSRYYKDIPLLNMGSIFHLTGKISDAITIIKAGIDHDPLLAVNHYAIGNTYAIHGDFHSAVKHYNFSIRLQPEFTRSVLNRYGARCVEKQVKHLHNAIKLVKQLRKDIGDYCEQEMSWMKSQAAFLKAMHHNSEYDYRDLGNNVRKMSYLTGYDINSMKRQGDKYSLIKHMLEQSRYKGPMEGVHAIDAVFHWKDVVNEIKKHASHASELVIRPGERKSEEKKVAKAINIVIEIARKSKDGKKESEENKKQSSEKKSSDKQSSDNQSSAKESSDRQSSDRQSSDRQSSQNEDDGLLEYLVGVPLYPVSMKVNRQLQDFDTEPDWPSNQLCKEVVHNLPDNVEALYPIFLPFENKGIRLNKLLTDKIGVPASVEHELPWYPPQCPQDKDAAAYLQKKSQKAQIANEIIKDVSLLRLKLLEYVGEGDYESVKNMQEVEVGQRIHSAMQMKLAPKWVLYTLASLYWRVRGNNANALNCLIPASKLVKSTKYRDLVLASLASVYLEMGYFDEAFTAAESAFHINLYEPATNFILAELNMIKKNRNTYMFHLKQIVRVETNYMDGLARKLLNGWACIMKQLAALQEFDVDLSEDDICTEMEPGVSMRCAKDGTNCRVSYIQCFQGQNTGASAIVRMLKDENFYHEALADASLLDEVVANMPSDHTDKVGHSDNYLRMMQTIEKALISCAAKRCSSLLLESVTPKAEDCQFKYQQLSYWLQLVSFSHAAKEADFSKLTEEVPTMTPSSRKEPDCRLDVDPDNNFFLERLNAVDTEKWEPVLSLMHHLADMYNLSDFLILGAKYAKYVDTRPQSWLGALGAGWWCGAAGRGACAARCLAAAFALAPPGGAAHALRALGTLLHMQSKRKDAKDIAYLALYYSPKSQVEAFYVAVSHTALAQYDQALWMYRYSLSFDSNFTPSKSCLHLALCLRHYGDNSQTSESA